MQTKRKSEEYNLHLNKLCIANFKMFRKCNIVKLDKLLKYTEKNNLNIGYNIDENEKINIESSEKDNNIDRSINIKNENNDELGELNKKCRTLSI